MGGAPISLTGDALLSELLDEDVDSIEAAAAAIARSRSQSGNTMNGDLPPSSSEIRLRFPAAARTIERPVSVEPVKAILSTPGWSTSAAPATSPMPGVMLTTPGGKPTCRINSSFLQPAQEPDEIGRLGAYRVLAVIGVGGMGVVFEAEQRSPRRPVALKVLRAQLSSSRTQIERLKREAQLAARHPSRPLKANVEFYTAVLLDALGLGRHLFTPTFAVGRVAGWCAHAR